MWNAGLNESQPGVKISGEAETASDMQKTSLMPEGKGAEEPFDEGEKGEWKD